MADQHPRDRARRGSPSPADEDVFDERAVLFFVLDLHPSLLTAAEILHGLCPDPEDFRSRDGVERAIRDLVAAGVLRRDGETIAPTHATLRLRRLEER